uniref:Uncharacterized protein n=1 Tax=Solanum lycopersicum TaxID=4081 RepID=A0A3Q7EE75_SOLLC
MNKVGRVHGDRDGYDDPATVSDIGSIEGRSYLFIGHPLCNENPLWVTLN